MQFDTSFRREILPGRRRKCILFIEGWIYGTVFDIRMMIEHPLPETVGISLGKGSLVDHDAFIALICGQLEIRLCLFELKDLIPFNLIVDLPVDIQRDVLVADNYLACPVLAVKVGFACYAEGLVGMHPSEKYSSVYCYEGKKSPDGLPPCGGIHFVEIYPAEYTGYKNGTIYIKNR